MTKNSFVVEKQQKGNRQISVLKYKLMRRNDTENWKVRTEYEGDDESEESNKTRTANKLAQSF